MRGPRQGGEGGVQVKVLSAPAGTAAALEALQAHRAVERLWAEDHTLWNPSPVEIRDRMGWLHLPSTMAERAEEFRRFAEEVRESGLREALLLGMGGSSLAPETFAGLLGCEKEGMPLHVLDSTHPAAVEAAWERQDPSRTLLIVSTKTGTTVETLSLFRLFYRRLTLSVGADRARRQCVAITDPGSPLASEAGRLRLLRLFLGDPTVGGRYAALSPFGLLPAALIGIDLQALVRSAGAMADACRAPAQTNPAAQLAAALAAAAWAGRDKLTLTTSTSTESLAPWIEQLVAESTGKDGRGILPVLGEPLGPPSAYGSDRVFLELRLAEESPDPQLAPLEGAGQPSVSVVLGSAGEVGGAFFLWECATALLAHLMGVHPFNQPNVDSAKDLARREVEDYCRTGRVDEVVPEPLLAEDVAAFVDEGRAGDYVALQVFLPPEERTREALGALRQAIRGRTCFATSQGYGPRYLHSVGQLHKGDRGNGRFIQLLSPSGPDVLIPDDLESEGSTLSFGALIAAQAAGDRRALRAAGRPVLARRVDPPLAGAVRRVADALSRLELA